jgi:adenylate cyclase
MLGELIPIGGGDPIPLLKEELLVGRRESCDIVLRFANISAHHCKLYVKAGYWYVLDQNSRNGIKVNGMRVDEKRLDPGDTLAIARHRYEVRYDPADLGAVGPPPIEDATSDVFGKSLLERAGLERKKDKSTRYEVTDNREGQLKRDRNRPV